MPHYKYDLAISFAGEQRPLASTVATALDSAGYSIFYDRFEQAELWGRELTTTLGQVYSDEARYCLVLLSSDYVTKPWTNLERQNALARFMNERSGYILCLRLDPVNLPGLPSVVAYVDFSSLNGTPGLIKLLMQKLGQPDHQGGVSTLSRRDRTLAQGLIKACFRRAVFTRMDSEINMDAMRASIGDAISMVQPKIPDISEPSLQRAALEILASLDSIERLSTRFTQHISNLLPTRARTEIDGHKRDIIRLLLEVRRAAKLQMQLPFDLEYHHFFSVEQANEPPELAA